MHKILGLLLSILLLGQAHPDSFDPETSRAVAVGSQLLTNNILNTLTEDPSQHLRAEGWNVIEAKLSDVAFEHIDNSVTFKNAVLKGMSQVQTEELTPNLMDQTLQYTVAYRSVVIEGRYEDSSTGSKDIFVNLENVKVQGVAGFSFKGSVPVVHNIKADFLKNGITVHDAESQEKIRFIAPKIVDQIADNLKDEVAQYLRENLKQYFNSILAKNSLDDLFNYNKSVVERYRSAITGRDNKVNQVVDYLLALVTQFFKESGYDKVAIPEIHESYKKKVGFIKVKGSFDADHGYVRDPTTLHRTGDFSIHGSWDGPEFQLYGSLGFSTLQAKYDHYRAKFAGISVSGHVEANINSNSVFFSVKAKYLNPNLIHINSYDIKVERFDDIKVKANGMGDALNWLYSKALTSVANHMKGKVVQQLETSAHRVIDNKLNSMGWNIPIKF